MNDRVTFALRAGDDALVAAQRLSECITNAPQIEEDVAAANIALDLLGQARAWYEYAGAQHPDHPSEDDFAYRRSEREFTNALLVELPNRDFAHTVVRGFAFAAYQQAFYSALSLSPDDFFSPLALKCGREVAYHVKHFSSWVVRLGDGTAESHRRSGAALEAVWPYTHELFSPDEVSDRLTAAGVAPDPAALRAPFEELVAPVLEEATLTLPETSWRPGGGRAGLHTEAFGYLLAEMQSVARAYPAAQW